MTKTQAAGVFARHRQDSVAQPRDVVAREAVASRHDAPRRSSALLGLIGDVDARRDASRRFGDRRRAWSASTTCAAISDCLEALGVRDWVTLDLSIVRGLAYYTGIVFELFDAKGEFRAICGGGRYDTFSQSLGGVDLPALGFGMGDVVLGELLRARGSAAGAELADRVLGRAPTTTRCFPMRCASRRRCARKARSVEYALETQYARATAQDRVDGGREERRARCDAIDYANGKRDTEDGSRDGSERSVPTRCIPVTHS